MRRPGLGPTGSNWLQFSSIQLNFFLPSLSRSTKEAQKMLMKIVPVSSLCPQQESERSTLEPLNKPVWEHNAEQTAAVSFILIFIYYFRATGFLHAAGFYSLRGFLFLFYKLGRVLFNVTKTEICYVNRFVVQQVLLSLRLIKGFLGMFLFCPRKQNQMNFF